ncbi:hypothetical protein NHQ30_008975 [Ciborinia camelliae]|nr:hypothetical protein NHQ30_008975 [Ciborinia camelliae]
MYKLRQPPSEVPKYLYFVHDPSNDQPSGDLDHSSKRSYSPYDIGFRPINLLDKDRAAFVSYFGQDFDINSYLASICVAVTDDVEAARNRVISSEKELVMYELDGQCEEMGLCAVFKSKTLLKPDNVLIGDGEDDYLKKILSKWLVWPSIPKEAITDESRKEDILNATGKLRYTSSDSERPRTLTFSIEQEQQSLKHSRAPTQQRTTAGPSRNLKHKPATKGKANFPSNSNVEGRLGFVCDDVDLNGNPQYMAIPAEEQKFPFSTIYIIEQRKAGLQCLIHWGPGIEPTWLRVRDVDARAVKEYHRRKVKVEKKKGPKNGDPFEIIFEEPHPEQPEKDTCALNRFLVKWTNTGIVTWETYGSDPGVTRIAGSAFMAEKRTWKRYLYT